MKVLSLLQPWASMVVLGAKQFETRSWKTEFRGTILIHASLKQTAAKKLLFEKPFLPVMADHTCKAKLCIEDYPFGMIIGKVDIVSMTPTRNILPGTYTESKFIPETFKDPRLLQLTGEEMAFGDYSARRWAWELKNPVRFSQPIPAKGALSLWDYEFDAETPDVFQCADCGYTAGVEKFCFAWIGPKLDELDTFCRRCDSRHIDSIMEDETPGVASGFFGPANPVL